jgi:Kef-type K+ transport system membrane component KefB/mannitol/fructose-specific phosphotransferase system IIA component (Ntr-type)
MMAHIERWLHHETALITSPNPLLVLSVILMIGYVFTRIAGKLRLPAVTGQILGGVLIGHYVLNLFVEEAYQSFAPITNFALGFIGLTIGSHLDFRKLHNAGKRIILITLTDVVITPVIVYFSLHYLAGLSAVYSLLIAAIAITTAPGSTIHVVKEKRAKGMFTKTLLAVVALNNVLTILIFYTLYYFLHNKSIAADINVFNTIGNSALLLLESIVIGSGVGYAVIYFTEKRKTHVSFLVMVILAVVLTVGASETLHLSGILSSLILGMIITNFSKYRHVLFGSFKEIEVEVFTLFFVLAGTHLDFHSMGAAGVAGIVLIVSRFVGKSLAPTLGAWIASATPTIKRNIGLAMHPIAGVAIGLVLLIEHNELLAPYANQITAIVLTAVVVYELIGPLFTGRAIQRAGEAQKNRLRLMDFIQEEYITVDLDAADKWQTLDYLAEFMVKTHKADHINLQALKKSLTEREQDITTGIGNNLAIPHAVIEKGPQIIGVIGISRAGIEFESLDGKPVHIIFMIATPKENFDRQHLQVLANVAKLFGHHKDIKSQLIKCRSAAEVYEVLQSEEVEELNPFFEE